MEETYYIRIKKDYAAAVIEDLEKMDAVEFITEDNIVIPQWQMDKVRESIKFTEENPTSAVDWQTLKQKIKRG